MRSTRQKLYPSVGYLYPAGSQKLADVTDESQIEGALSAVPEYQKLYSSISVRVGGWVYLLVVCMHGWVGWVRESRDRGRLIGGVGVSEALFIPRFRCVWVWVGGWTGVGREPSCAYMHASCFFSPNTHTHIRILTLQPQGMKEKTLEDVFYEQDVRATEVAFEGQMHFGGLALSLFGRRRRSCVCAVWVMLQWPPCPVSVNKPPTPQATH